MNVHKKIFSKIGFNYLIFAISAIIIQIILLNIINVASPKILENYNILVILSAVCNYVIPLPLMVYLMKKIDSDDIERNSLSVLKFLKYFALTVTLLWVGNITGLIITSLIGGVTQTDIVNPVENLINSSDMLLNLFLVSIIGPIFEEFFFRKLLIDRTIKYGARVSIILSAIIFGLFHGNLNQFFYATLLGGLLAYVYIKTGNIIYPILLHIATNFMGAVVSTFFGESTQKLISGAGTPIDMTFVGIYVIIIIISLLIGLISLVTYKKSKFNGSKTKIALDHPLKTMFLNYGMICFIAFCLFQIIKQLMG